MGSVPHYFIVYKIVNNVVYGVFLTSKDRDFVIYEIVRDRTFVGNYASNIFSAITLDSALKSFVRIYDSKTEANKIFDLVKENMLKVLI